MGKSKPIVFSFYYTGICVVCNWFCGKTCVSVCGAVVVVEFVSFYGLVFSEETALFFFDLDIAEPYQFSGVGADCRDYIGHGMQGAVRDLDGGMEVHEAAAFGYGRHSLADCLLDGCEHAYVGAKLSGVQLRIAASQKEAAASVWQLFVVKRGKAYLQHH